MMIYIVDHCGRPVEVRNPREPPITGSRASPPRVRSVRRIRSEAQSAKGRQSDNARREISFSWKGSPILSSGGSRFALVRSAVRVASETRRYVDAVGGTHAKIICTRKTLPGLRALQKDAVRMGGGHNHRFGLSDGILIKDNHIALAGGIGEAIARARTSVGHMVRIEIEVDTLAQLQEVVDAGGIDSVLLDNMTPDQMREAVALVAGRFATQASGNVRLDTVRAIAETGVDLISIGALTHTVTALDIGLDIDL
jgi:nicotinate-nucleotide pyrophosphorylase (carboxylating)